MEKLAEKIIDWWKKGIKHKVGVLFLAVLFWPLILYVICYAVSKRLVLSPHKKVAIAAILIITTPITAGWVHGVFNSFRSNPKDPSGTTISKVESSASTTKQPETNTSTPPVATQAPSVSASQIQQKSTEEILKLIDRKYKQNPNDVIMEEKGEWYIVKQVEWESDFMMFSGVKQFSRDYIFEMYATKLPIRSVAVSITRESANKYFRAKLSKDVVDTQPQSTWIDKNIGPSIFYDFLKTHTNGSSGDGKDSTYVETNLE